jgi:hypothetical protein
MTTYNQGNNTFTSVLGGTETLTPADGVTSATINLLGVLTTWAITAPSGGAIEVINDVAVGNNLNLTTNGGSITLDSSFLSAGALGAVNATIDGGSFTVGASLINASVLNGASVIFESPGGTNVVGTDNSIVSIDLLKAFAPYQGFTNSSDIIDDGSLNFSDFEKYTVSGSGAVQNIVVTDSNGTSFSFQINGSDLATGSFNSLTAGPLQIIADGSGGTDITVCFLAGANTRTPNGEVAVETLKFSIVREINMPATFAYYHVESEVHSRIMAWGAPTETFVDNVDRMAFGNWDEHLAPYPEGYQIKEMPWPRARSHR